EAANPSWDHGQGRYAIATQGKGKASACVECGSCEAACPQHLEIIKLLKDCAGMEQ
ncbi:MAG: 4Fe-4S dicluster domain-containing protein, partial [Treponema sp.]|nr:4Fe-4S dicluster domain-containing protein [Treponema sp.]